MVKISQHAHERYVDKFGGNLFKGMERRHNIINKIIVFGIELKPKNTIMKLLNNRCKKAEYFMYRGVVAVLANNVVVTVYKYQPEKWEMLDKLAKGKIPMARVRL